MYCPLTDIVNPDFQDSTLLGALFQSFCNILPVGSTRLFGHPFFRGSDINGCVKVTESVESVEDKSLSDKSLSLHDSLLVLFRLGETGAELRSEEEVLRLFRLGETGAELWSEEGLRSRLLSRFYRLADVEDLRENLWDRDVH